MPATTQETTIIRRDPDTGTLNAATSVFSTEHMKKVSGYTKEDITRESENKMWGEYFKAGGALATASVGFVGGLFLIVNGFDSQNILEMFAGIEAEVVARYMVGTFKKALNEAGILGRQTKRIEQSDIK